MAELRNPPVRCLMDEAEIVAAVSRLGEVEDLMFESFGPRTKNSSSLRAP